MGISLHFATLKCVYLYENIKLSKWYLIPTYIDIHKWDQRINNGIKKNCICDIGIFFMAIKKKKKKKSTMTSEMDSYLYLVNFLSSIMV